MKDAEFTTLRQVLATNLRDQRLQQSMTQEELAASAGLTQKTISMIETGTYATTIDSLQRLSAALKIRASRLLDEG
jgi:transcriptional regulator with XRE-family HTH domain